MLHKYFKYVASKSCLNIKVKDLVLYLSPRAKVLYLFPASLQNVPRQPTTIEQQQEENTITIELKRSGQFEKALALKSEKIVYCPIEKVGQRPNPDVTLWPLTPPPPPQRDRRKTYRYFLFDSTICGEKVGNIDSLKSKEY